MLCGIPGCGKSFWAQEKQRQEPGRWKIVSRDPLRAMLDGGQYSPENEQFVISAERQLITLALSQGFSVIVDDTNLHVGMAESFRELGCEVEIHDFMQQSSPAWLALCIERDRQRPHPVGEERIREMYARYYEERGIEV
jgi:tRNA uridine 5-carbamoylmethylation protein Kti12